MVFNNYLLFLRVEVFFDKVELGRYRYLVYRGFILNIVRLFWFYCSVYYWIGVFDLNVIMNLN